MKILYRYIIHEILRFSMMVMVAVLTIYLSVEFFERIDNFMEAHLPVSRALVFLIYRIPFVISQTLPLCVCLGILITFGLMSRHNEIIALKSAGISAKTLAKPVLASGFGFSLLLLLFNEILVPVTAEHANKIWLQEVKNRTTVVLRERNVWLKENRLILHIAYYDKNSLVIYGITLFEFDDAFRMTRRLDAEKGYYLSGLWVMENAMEQVMEAGTTDYAVQFHPERRIRLNLTPESLETVVRQADEMGIISLYDFVRKVESEGYDATPYRVDLHAKIAFPLICIILNVIGMGVSLMSRQREGIARRIAIGLGFAFLYWILFSLSLSMGYGGMIPPFVAAWSTNLVFSCVACIILLNVDS